MNQHGHDTHGEPVADAQQTATAHAETAHAPSDTSFEKSELTYFEAEDRGAGKNIGILLAFVFCILLALMSGVTLWTQKHASKSHNPHDYTSGHEDAGHH